MTMSTRYTTPGPWTTTAFTAVHDYNRNKIGSVSIEVGPLVDTRTSTRYPQGAERVVITGPAGRPRGKTFRGEMAWCQAESYAHDAVQWLDQQAHKVSISE
jgi:hypothetical protein